MCVLHTGCYAESLPHFCNIWMLILQVFFKNSFLYQVQMSHWSGMLIVRFFHCWCLKCLFREHMSLQNHCILTWRLGSGQLRETSTFLMCQHGVIVSGDHSSHTLLRLCCLFQCWGDGGSLLTRYCVTAF